MSRENSEEPTPRHEDEGRREEQEERSELEELRGGSEERERGEKEKNRLDGDDLFSSDEEEGGFFQGFDVPQDKVMTIQKKRAEAYDRPSKRKPEQEGEESSQEKKFANELEEVEHRLKLSKKRKTNPNADIYYRELGTETLIEMNQAWLEDDAAVENGKPAYKKLKLLPKLEKVFVIKEFLNHLRKDDFLTTCMKWLLPLKRDQLPNIAIRSFILRILSQFEMDDDNLSDLLKESNIGNAVMYLFKHPQETLGNKKMAKQLIYKWSRSVLNLGPDFQGPVQHQRAEPTRVVITASQPESQSSQLATSLFSTSNVEEEDKRVRARIPAPTTFDFKIRPKSTIEEIKDKGGKKAESSLHRVKPVKKTQHAINMSVEGRGLK